MGATIWNYDGDPERDDGGIYFSGHGTPWGIAPDWGRKEVRHYIEHNAMYWLDEFHFDGLRWDFTNEIKNKPNGWEAMRDIVWSVRGKFPEHHDLCSLPYERKSWNQVISLDVTFHHKLKRLPPATAAPTQTRREWGRLSHVTSG
jgi:1,4-alpha-glucan branching enzyme